MVTKNLSLVHEVLAPIERSKKPPLLLLLHGYGSHENDLFSMAPMLNQKFLVVSVRAPQSIGFGGFAWYEINFSNEGVKTSNTEQAKESMTLIREFIAEVHEAYGSDEQCVSLLGFSQGAILSYGLSLGFPKEFKNVLALSGYVLSDLLPQKFDIPAISKLQFFVSHGLQDEVIPVAWAQKGLGVLDKLKVVYAYREYEMGHGVNPACFEDVQQWLREQKLI